MTNHEANSLNHEANEAMLAVTLTHWPVKAAPRDTNGALLDTNVNYSCATEAPTNTTRPTVMTSTTNEPIYATRAER